MYGNKIDPAKEAQLVIGDVHVEDGNVVLRIDLTTTLIDHHELIGFISLLPSEFIGLMNEIADLTPKGGE